MAVSITGAGFATINDGCGGALFIAEQNRHKNAGIIAGARKFRPEALHWNWNNETRPTTSFSLDTSQCCDCCSY
jgi:hypothetical protein